MNDHEKRIRRHANGSIDTDYYIRQCHRARGRRVMERLERTARGASGVIRGFLASY